MTINDDDDGDGDGDGDDKIINVTIIHICASVYARCVINIYTVGHKTGHFICYNFECCSQVQRPRSSDSGPQTAQSFWAPNFSLYPCTVK